jgi:predicted Rossmann fold nucleotide-binding protein DprA/Smf involved in DNA uptake
MQEQQAQMQQVTNAIVDSGSDDKGGATAPLEGFRPDTDDDLLESVSKSAGPPPSPEEKLLRAMQGGKYTFRTVNGLAKDTGMDASLVETMLQSLEKRGKIQSMRRASDGETLWMLRR